MRRLVIATIALTMAFTSCQKSTKTGSTPAPEPTTKHYHAISGTLSPGEMHNMCVNVYKDYYGFSDHASPATVARRVAPIYDSLFGTTTNVDSFSIQFVRGLADNGLLDAFGNPKSISDFLSITSTINTDETTKNVMRNITAYTGSDFENYVNEQISSLSYLTGPDAEAIQGYKSVLLSSYSNRSVYDNGQNTDATRQQISDADSHGYWTGFWGAWFTPYLHSVAYEYAVQCAVGESCYAASH